VRGEVQQEEDDERFRSLVLDRPDLLLERVRALEPDDVDEWRLEQLCCVMDDGTTTLRRPHVRASRVSS
jgi:hypothetical protein